MGPTGKVRGLPSNEDGSTVPGTKVMVWKGRRGWRAADEGVGALFTSTARSKLRPQAPMYPSCTIVSRPISLSKVALACWTSGVFARRSRAVKLTRVWPRTGGAKPKPLIEGTKLLLWMIWGKTRGTLWTWLHQRFMSEYE